MKEKINQLRELLDKANNSYYVSDAPIMSDFEYDIKMRELKDLELQFPEFASKNSPTQKVGGTAAFSPVSHIVPLESLSDVFSFDELKAFDERIRENFSDAQYCIEPKIDGLSVALTYNNGKLQQGATRGNGQVGEDVTHNILTIDSIPQEISYKQKLVVRGEVYMSPKIFNKLNQQRELDGKPLLANPRNAAAGSLRQLTMPEDRKLDFFSFNIQFLEADDFPKNHSDTLDFLSSLGFPTVQYTLVNNLDNAWAEIENIGNSRLVYPFDMDGAVIKVNSLYMRKSLGSTSKAPRWAAAYKYPPEQKETKLIDIIIQVGRTGILTPKAVLEPVRLAGTTVKYATLHNQDFIALKDIRIGDYVIVQKAGEIIPEIIGVVFEKRVENLEPYLLPTNCPTCGQQVVKEDVAVRCVNSICPSQRIRSLSHFASRDAMDIEGLGSSTCEMLVEKNLVNTFADIYKLSEQNLSVMDGFGEKSINNLLSNIESSKHRDLSCLLYAFGIRHVGQKNAKIIASHFGSIDKIQTASIEELTSINEVGEIIAQSLHDWLLVSKCLIDELINLGINVTGKKIVEQDLFGGKSFVITGTLTKFTRDQAQKLIEQNGGKASSSVSSKTAFLVAGEAAGSKLTKAQSLGVKILNEDEFLELFNR